MINTTAKNTYQAAFEFETLVDIDLGLLIYIQLNFAGSNYFIPQVMKADNYVLRSLLLTRDKVNPLSVIIKDEYMDSIDNLYNEILDSKFLDIANISPPLATFKLYRTLCKTDGLVDAFIICMNEKQASFLNGVDKRMKTTTDGYNTKLYQVDALYVKVFDLIYKYKNLVKKSIYIMDYDFNIEPNRKDRIPKLDLARLLGATNNIYIVAPYHNFNNPIG